MRRVTMALAMWLRACDSHLFSALQLHPFRELVRYFDKRLRHKLNVMGLFLVQ